jgi:hypothetical protein
MVFLFTIYTERLFMIRTREMFVMTIRDRGKIKWQASSFLPQIFEMQREMFKDQERQPRPLLSEFDTEEFDQRISYAMEYNLAVRLTYCMGRRLYFGYNRTHTPH